MTVAGQENSFQQKQACTMVRARAGRAGLDRLIKAKEKAKMERENLKSRATTLKKPRMDVTKDNNAPDIIEG
jgi:hypothetical protein